MFSLNFKYVMLLDIASKKAAIWTKAISSTYLYGKKLFVCLLVVLLDTFLSYAL